MLPSHLPARSHTVPFFTLCKLSKYKGKDSETYASRLVQFTYYLATATVKVSNLTRDYPEKKYTVNMKQVWMSFFDYVMKRGWGRVANSQMAFSILKHLNGR